MLHWMTLLGGFSMDDVVIFPRPGKEVTALLSPEDLEVLCQTGVLCPFSQGLFQPFQSLSLSYSMTNSSVVVFGATDMFSELAIECVTGSVIERVSKGGALLTQNFANSSLRQFVACATALHSRFPFYSDHDGNDVFAAVSDDVRSMVAQIDVKAAEPDTFWGTVCDDIAIGDWSSEDIEAARWLE